MDYSLPSCSAHEIFQARILEWIAISYYSGSSQPRRGLEPVSLASSPLSGKFFTTGATWGAHNTIKLTVISFHFNIWTRKTKKLSAYHCIVFDNKSTHTYIATWPTDRLLNIERYKAYCYMWPSTPENIRKSNWCTSWIKIQLSYEIKQNLNFL